MEYNPTPGHWHVTERDDYGDISVYSNRELPYSDGAGNIFAMPVAVINATPDGDRRANAHLIAAAPEMLELIKLAIEKIDNSHYPRLTRQLKDVIEKAELGSHPEKIFINWAQHLEWQEEKKP